MGKVFAENEEFEAFFGLLERQLDSPNATFKLNQIEGMFYLMSLRETAPLALSEKQATLFAEKLLVRIEERVRMPNQLSRLINASLKAYAGLMRYRLVRSNYMTSEDPALGERQRLVLEELLERSQHDGRTAIANLTKSLIEWSEQRGTDHTILQWDEDENDDEDDDI